MTVRSITQCRDDITTLLLVLLVCMENIFKELFLFLPSQGVSLSIADAKVDTFYKLTKHSWNFFARFFNTKSQKADLQELSNTKNLQKCTQIGIYMLQNIKKRPFYNKRALSKHTARGIPGQQSFYTIYYISKEILGSSIYLLSNAMASFLR